MHTNISIHAIKAAHHPLQQKELGDAEVMKAITVYGGLEQYIKAHQEVLQINLEASERKFAEFAKHGIKVTNILEADYPEILRELKTPPTILYYYGDLNQLNFENNIALVGTRHASIYGETITCALVQSLSGSEACIVSGLAAGIDSAAHGEALDSGMSTIAILGSGLLEFNYAGVQRELFKRMQTDAKSLIISEFAPDQTARAWTYAHRNRLIAALSKATIVIEAPKTSGALITAEHALKMQRRLYAIPADLTKLNFKGSNKLLAEGKAQPIFDYAQLMELLDLKLKAITEQDSNYIESPTTSPILDAITDQGVTMDYLIDKLKLNQAKLFAELTILEMKGLIRKSNGAKYNRT